MDSNHRSHRRRIYSPLHLAALQPTQKKWSWQKESNLQPADYKSAALPLSHASTFCKSKLTTYLSVSKVAKIKPPYAPMVPFSFNKTTSDSAKPYVTLWCPKVESNHRHRDFQSLALPTELSGQNWRLG